MKTVLNDALPSHMNIPRYRISSHPSVRKNSNRQGVGNVRKGPVIVAPIKQDTDKKTKELLAADESKTEIDYAPEWEKIIEKKKNLVNKDLKRATSAPIKEKAKKKERKEHRFMHKKKPHQGFNVS